jgi:hypothetical protein
MKSNKQGQHMARMRYLNCGRQVIRRCSAHAICRRSLALATSPQHREWGVRSRWSPPSVGGRGATATGGGREEPLSPVTMSLCLLDHVAVLADHRRASRVERADARMNEASLVEGRGAIAGWGRRTAGRYWMGSLICRVHGSSGRRARIICRQLWIKRFRCGHHGPER